MAKKVHTNYNVIVFERYVDGDVTFNDITEVIPDKFLAAMENEEDATIPVMIFIASGYLYWMFTGLYTGAYRFKCINGTGVDDIVITE